MGASIGCVDQGIERMFKGVLVNVLIGWFRVVEGDVRSCATGRIASRDDYAIITPVPWIQQHVCYSIN